MKLSVSHIVVHLLFVSALLGCALSTGTPDDQNTMETSVGAVHQPEVRTLDWNTFLSVVSKADHQPWAVLFQVDWCQPCAEFKPQFDAFVEDLYAGEHNYTILKQIQFAVVNATQEQKLRAFLNVTEYPSIRFLYRQQNYAFNRPRTRYNVAGFLRGILEDSTTGPANKQRWKGHSISGALAELLARESDVQKINRFGKYMALAIGSSSGFAVIFIFCCCLMSSEEEFEAELKEEVERFKEENEDGEELSDQEHSEEEEPKKTK